MKEKQTVILNSIKALLELGRVESNNREINTLLKSLEFKEFASSISTLIIRKNIGSAIEQIDEFLYNNIQKNHQFGMFDIKIFDFDFLQEININQLKTKIGLEKLHLNLIKNSDGTNSDIYRHWENAGRFQVLIPKYLTELIKNDEESLLCLKKEIKISDKGYFSSFLISDYNDLYDDTEDYDNDDSNDYNYDNTNWDLWNDDLDADHQDPDFWNQF